MRVPVVCIINRRVESQMKMKISAAAAADAAPAADMLLMLKPLK